LPRTSLVVLNLATGQRRQWSGGNRQAFFDSMALTANGTTLAFAAEQLRGVDSAVYLLDTSAAPGPVAQRGRILVKSTDLPHVNKLTNVAITPDGQTVYFTASGAGAARPTHQRWSVDTSTGRTRSAGART
jgi:hypothetical protein